MNKSNAFFAACFAAMILVVGSPFEPTEATQTERASVPEVKFIPIGNLRINLSRVDYYVIGGDHVILHFAGGELLTLRNDENEEFRCRLESGADPAPPRNQPFLQPKPSDIPLCKKGKPAPDPSIPSINSKE
jgi:hypothetical protein